MPSMLQRAVLELGIDVPVWRSDIDEDRRCVVLYLVGHTDPATWTPPEWVETDASAPEAETVTTPAAGDPVTTDDLTVIPGVGAKTADALYDAGIRTFAALQEADDHALKDLVGSYTLAKIREFLYVHFT